jgi:hypothetical protein
MHHGPYIRRRDRRALQQSGDPVTLFTAGAVAFTASTGVILTAEAFAIGAFITSAAITAGVSIGLNAAVSALSGSQKQSALTGGQGISVGDQGLRVPVRQPIPPQRLVLGTVTASGALFFQRSDPPYIWLGYELASHECGDFVSLILNGITVPLEDPGTGILRPTAAPFYDGSVRYLEVSYRNGDANQAIDPIIARDITNPAMPATFRQRRHATVVIKANYGTTDAIHKDVYGSEGNFNPLFRFQGAALPDPRKPGFDEDDANTWVTGSSNASLGLARYLIHPWPNMRLVDPGKLNWDLIAAAADIDDQWRGKADGSKERNHTADGVIFSTDDPFETCRRLLTANDGLLVIQRGKYHVLPGTPRDPIGTIDQDMIAGGFEFQTETADRDLINIVKTEMVAPDREYNTVVGPVLRRDDLIVTDGRPLETTLSLPFTEGDARAQRFANRKLLETRTAGAISGTFTIAASRYKAGDIVTFDFRDFPEVFGTYQIRKTARDPSMMRVQTDAVRWSNDRFAWHAPSEQKAFTLDEDVLAAEAA